MSPTAREYTVVPSGGISPIEQRVNFAVKTLAVLVHGQAPGRGAPTCLDSFNA